MSPPPLIVYLLGQNNSVKRRILGAVNFSVLTLGIKNDLLALGGEKLLQLRENDLEASGRKR